MVLFCSRAEIMKPSLTELSENCGLVAGDLVQELFQLNSINISLCKPCALGAVRAPTVGAGAALGPTCPHQCSGALSQRSTGALGISLQKLVLTYSGILPVVVKHRHY